jgi:hypothetical protein
MKAFYGGKHYADIGRSSTGARTAISTASARGTGLVMWSPYRTPTFWPGDRRDAYIGRRRSDIDAAPALTRFVAVRSLKIQLRTEG